MPPLPPPRRNLRDISSLFVTQTRTESLSSARASATPSLEPHYHSASAPEIPRLPMLNLASFDVNRLNPLLAYGISRWLLTAFRRISIAAPFSQAPQWHGFARDFLGSPGDSPAPHQLKLDKNLEVIFSEEVVPELPGIPIATPTANGDEVWAFAEKHNPPPEHLVVRIVGEDIRRLAVQHDVSSQLWMFVLAPEVTEFIDCYRFIKNELLIETPVSPQHLDRHFLVLDFSGSENDLKPVQDAWLSITSHYLGLNVPIIGGVDLPRLNDTSMPMARRLRQCEERLGPPWPSDLQLACGEAVGAAPPSPAAIDLPAAADAGSSRSFSRTSS